MYQSMMKLKYYIRRIFDYPEVKIALSGFCTILTELFGVINEPIQILMILIIVDLITGISKHIKKGTVYSRPLRKSCWKVSEYIIFIFLGNMGQRIGINGFRNLVIFWINFTELISIMENLDDLGFHIPEFISDKLQKGKDNVK